MKLFAKALTFTGVVLFSAGAGIGVSYAAIEWINPPDERGSATAPDGVNEFGETFGPEGFGEEYDLITAIGDNGSVGYLRSEDLNGPDFRSPEEALAWQEENFEEIRTIPLYASDGRTVIGTFTLETYIGSGDGKEFEGRNR